MERETGRKAQTSNINAAKVRPHFDDLILMGKSSFFPCAPLSN
jgi:hypothetical protein